MFGIVCMVLLASCGGPSTDRPQTGSGTTIDVTAIIRGFTDAGTIVSASVRSIWGDVEKRTTDIAEGAQKIREGKEQMEKGIRGNELR